MGSGFGTVRGCYYVSVDNYSFIDNIHAEIGKLLLSVRSLKMICCGFSAFEYAAFSQRKSACAYCGYRLVLTVEAADKLRKGFAVCFLVKAVFLKAARNSKCIKIIGGYLTYQHIHYNGYAESGYHGFIGSAGGYAYGTAKIIFAQPITSAKALNSIVSKPLHSFSAVYCTVP